MGLQVQGLTPRAYLARSRKSSNLWRRVRFEICGIELERLLVPEMGEMDEISSQSAVGRVLLTASAGDRIVVEAPGGDVVVKVLEVIIDQNGEVW